MSLLSVGLDPILKKIIYLTFNPLDLDRLVINQRNETQTEQICLLNTFSVIAPSPG